MANSGPDGTPDVVIVGAGPGGLAVSQQLGVRGVAHVVLEKGPHPGWMWPRTYDSLRLHTGKHLSALPGMPYPKDVSLFPSRAEFMAYLESYVDRFDLPIRYRAEARELRRDGDAWHIETSAGGLKAQAVVVATGIMSHPVMPDIPGLQEFQGRVLHSAAYRRPEEFANARVLVVGIGNSGAEIAVELAARGARTAVSVRSGANNVPLKIAGVPTQYLGWAISWLPRGAQQRLTRLFGTVGAAMRGGSPIPRKRGYGACPDVPLIGMKLANALRSGSIELRPGVRRFTSTGAVFTDGERQDFDAIVLATGYRAALDWMGAFGGRDECGFGDRQDRVRSAAYPNLYFVGHNYDGRGGLYNIASDAKRIARLVSAVHGE